MFAFPAASPQLSQQQRFSRRAGGALDRHCLRPLTVQFLALLEGATAWVTGVAWTDAIVAWTTLGAQPDARVAFGNIGLCLLLTCAAGGWLAFSGRRSDAISLSDEDKGSREEVELFFATNEAIFVIGWAWVVLLRDLSVLSAEVLSLAFGVGAAPGRAALAGVTAFVFGPLVGVVVACRG